MRLIARCVSGHLGLMLLLTIGALVGCAQLPVPARAPYTAAPPSSSVPWQPPPGATADRPRVVAVRGTPVAVDPNIVYGLADLIDFAHRANPETRRAWEEARAAAARVGRAEAAYYPTLSFMAAGGTSRVADQAPSLGTFTVEGLGVNPRLQLNWILLDFGRRSGSVERRGQELFEANFAFNRKLQEVAFSVSRNYFSLDASRARVTAARATLESAVAVEEAVAARREQGLATRPDFLLARQERARAAFEVADAVGTVADAQAALADSLGIPPTTLMHVADLSALAVPTELAESVEQIIDRALRRRPDLAARLAALRAREAEERRARAEFWPRLFLSGSAGQAVQRYRVGPPPGTFTMNETEYGAFLNFEWKLFDGFERENALREATSLRGAAEAELAALELRAIREVWKTYADVKTALSKYEYALSLLAASQEAYEATLESYRAAGLATVLDLLAAQRDLARARTTEIQSRAELLTTSAALTFAPATDENGGALPRRLISALVRKDHLPSLPPSRPCGRTTFQSCFPRCAAGTRPIANMAAPAADTPTGFRAVDTYDPGVPWNRQQPGVGSSRLFALDGRFQQCCGGYTRMRRGCSNC